MRLYMDRLDYPSSTSSRLGRCRVLLQLGQGLDSTPLWTFAHLPWSAGARVHRKYCPGRWQAALSETWERWRASSSALRSELPVTVLPNFARFPPPEHFFGTCSTCHLLLPVLSAIQFCTRWVEPLEIDRSRPRGSRCEPSTGSVAASRAAPLRFLGEHRDRWESLQYLHYLHRNHRSPGDPQRHAALEQRNP